ncbi:hypothetical protein [Roseateles sp.]|uniref:hypothetical protein n=1 Tax=Roseateles sp. TaxID=1971397 RepID=UPI0039EC55C7
MDRHPSSTHPRLLAAIRLACLLAGGLAVGACTHVDVPRADNYPTSAQQKMRSLHHWDVLAADLAERLAPRVPGGTPVDVDFGADDSTFSKGLRTLLLSRLSERGVVFSSDVGALKLSIDTQVVRHSVPRPDESFRFTALGAGIAVLRDLVTHLPASGETLTANLVGAGIIADVSRIARQGRASGGPTGTELLVATVLRDGNRDLARTADIYYIERTDAALYRYSDDKSMKTWGVVNK